MRGPTHRRHTYATREELAELKQVERLAQSHGLYLECETLLAQTRLDYSQYESSDACVKRCRDVLSGLTGFADYDPSSPPASDAPVSTWLAQLGVYPETRGPTGSPSAVQVVGSAASETVVRPKLEADLVVELGAADLTCVDLLARGDLPGTGPVESGSGALAGAASWAAAYLQVRRRLLARSAAALARDPVLSSGTVSVDYWQSDCRKPILIVGWAGRRGTFTRPPSFQIRVIPVLPAGAIPQAPQWLQTQRAPTATRVRSAVAHSALLAPALEDSRVVYLHALSLYWVEAVPGLRDGLRLAKIWLSTHNFRTYDGLGSCAGLAGAPDAIHRNVGNAGDAGGVGGLPRLGVSCAGTGMMGWHVQAIALWLCGLRTIQPGISAVQIFRVLLSVLAGDDLGGASARRRRQALWVSSGANASEPFSSEPHSASAPGPTSGAGVVPSTLARTYGLGASARLPVLGTVEAASQAGRAHGAGGGSGSLLRPLLRTTFSRANPWGAPSVTDYLSRGWPGLRASGPQVPTGTRRALVDGHTLFPRSPKSSSAGVVLLDPNLEHNLLWRVGLEAYDELRDAAAAALDVVEQGLPDAFDTLFARGTGFFTRYDWFLSLPLASVISQTPAEPLGSFQIGPCPVVSGPGPDSGSGSGSDADSGPARASRGGSWFSQAVDNLMVVLFQGLGPAVEALGWRIVCPIAPSLDHRPSWAAPVAGPGATQALGRWLLAWRRRALALARLATCSVALGVASPERSGAQLVLGLSLNSGRSADDPVLRGPGQASPRQVRAFRAVWGREAQVRRFRDGRVQHAVVLAADPRALPPAPRRPAHIVRRAVRILVEQALGVVLKPTQLRTLGAPDWLGRALMHARCGGDSEGLRAVGDQGVHHLTPAPSAAPTAAVAWAALERILGEAAALPAFPARVLRILCLSLSRLHGAGLVPTHLTAPLGSVDEGWVRARWTGPPLAVGVFLEASSAWPGNLAAQQALKAALHVGLTEALDQTSRGVSPATWPVQRVTPHAHGVDVVVGGWPFRVALFPASEVALLTTLDEITADYRRIGRQFRRRTARTSHQESQSDHSGPQVHHEGAGSRRAGPEKKVASEAETEGEAEAETAGPALGRQLASHPRFALLQHPEHRSLEHPGLRAAAIRWLSGGQAHLSQLVATVAQRCPVAWVGAIHLAGLWLRSQLFWNHCSRAALDLLILAVFTHPSIYRVPPGSPWLGFCRWLELLARHSWRDLPLVVRPEAAGRRGRLARWRRAGSTDSATAPESALGGITLRTEAYIPSDTCEVAQIAFDTARERYFASREVRGSGPGTDHEPAVAGGHLSRVADPRGAALWLVHASRPRDPVWTATAPSWRVLERLQEAARRACRVVRRHLEQRLQAAVAGALATGPFPGPPTALLVPDLGDYDILVHVRLPYVPHVGTWNALCTPMGASSGCVRGAMVRSLAQVSDPLLLALWTAQLYQNLDVTAHAGSNSAALAASTGPNQLLIGLFPVQNFVLQLELRFGHVMDVYSSGGLVPIVGLRWRAPRFPPVLAQLGDRAMLPLRCTFPLLPEHGASPVLDPPSGISAPRIGAACLVPASQDWDGASGTGIGAVSMIPNTPQILTQVCALGAGLVERIEVCEPDG